MTQKKYKYLLMVKKTLLGNKSLTELLKDLKLIMNGIAIEINSLLFQNRNMLIHLLKIMTILK